MVFEQMIQIMVHIVFECHLKMLVYENKNVFSEIWANREIEQGQQNPHMAFREMIQLHTI